MAVKNIVKSYITTIIGLLFLVFMCIQLWDVSKGLQEFSPLFTGSLLVVGLALLFSSDYWIKRTLKKVVEKATEKL